MNEKKKCGHVGQPSSQENDLGKCDHCASYYFKSKTEKQRHLSVYHRGRKGNQTVNTKNYACDIFSCGKVFNSLTSLNLYKKQAKHIKRDDSKYRKAPPRKKRAKHYSFLKIGFLKAAVAKTDLLMNVMMMRE